MKRDSFIFYSSFSEAATALPDTERLCLFDAICAYALNAQIKPLTPLAAAMFCLIKPQLDANQRKFENGKKGAGFGKLGGRPSNNKPLNNPIGDNSKNPKQTPNVNVNANVKENANANSNENKNVKEVYSADFISFWNQFPNGGRGKSAAYQIFNKLKKDGLNVDTLITGAKRFSKHCRDNETEQQYIKHCSTWLNQQGWEDTYGQKEDYVNPKEPWIVNGKPVWHAMTDEQKKEYNESMGIYA